LWAAPYWGKALRTEQFVYVETDGDTPELYHTDPDPYQMNNLVGDGRYKKVIKQLRKRLQKGRF
jgi:hypothetical protein